jgi:hypothetical protein
MAKVYAVSWSIEYTRFIPCDSKREAIEICEGMGCGGDDVAEIEVGKMVVVGSVSEEQGQSRPTMRMLIHPHGNSS